MRVSLSLKSIKALHPAVPQNPVTKEEPFDEDIAALTLDQPADQTSTRQAPSTKMSYSRLREPIA